MKFKRYPHIDDLIAHYINALDRPEIGKLLQNGLESDSDAKMFSRFIWEMVEAVNEDEENGVVVLGSTDNTEMLPDLSYEITKLMKDSGYYSVWLQVSNDEM